MIKRKFWRWGYEDQVLPPAEDEAIASRILQLLGATTVLPSPEADHISLIESRISPPTALESIVTDDHLGHLSHSYRKSFPDLARVIWSNSAILQTLLPVLQCWADVSRVLDWANSERIAVNLYGGGSGVCEGIETDAGNGNVGVLSMDMKRMNKFIEIDLKSRAGHIQAGIIRTDLED